MKRFDYNPPQIKMKDYIKFMEWQERREEALHKKHEEKKKKDIILLISKRDYSSGK